MANVREPAYNALFTKIAGATGIANAQRRMMLPDVTDDTSFPALFQVQTGEKPRNIKTPDGRPLESPCKVDVYLYTKSPDPIAPATSTVWASSVMNPLIDAIELALKPNNNIAPTQTLGGTVQWVYITDIKYGEHLDGRLMAAQIEITFQLAS